jgi:hypothetical protein
MLISKCILLDRGYETVVCGLQTAKHGGIIFNYLSFEYLLVLVDAVLMPKFMSQEEQMGLLSCN